jgi:hypothetical protein
MGGERGPAGSSQWFFAVPPAFLAAILAFVLPSGAYEPGTPSPPPSTAPAAGSPATTAAIAATDDWIAQPAEHCIKRFLSPFEGFAGKEGESLAASDKKTGWRVDGSDPTRITVVPGAKDGPPTKPWTQQLEELKAHVAAGTLVETQIALVPDPIDSGMGYLFDVALDSVRVGVESLNRGLYRDRSWLPWDDRILTDKKEREASEACRRTTPGVVLFRGKDELLALLLVGESPTTGVHPTAMQRALEAAEVLRARVDSRPLPIVGPTFSGSVSSVRSALERWSPKIIRQLHIVTGAASGPHVVDDLHGSLGSGLTARVAATAIPQSSLECGYLHFLTEQLGVERPGGRVTRRRPTSSGARCSRGRSPS